SVITDALGNITRQDFYFPYGGELPTTTGSDSNHYKFTGKERDSESGLDNFGARYNASSLGRFMTPDPVSGTALHIINPQRWNMYAYAINSPLSYTDPDGRDAIAVEFSKPAGGLGHAGIGSVHQDGKGTFSDFGPEHAGRVEDAGKYTFIDLNTQIQYDANGNATKESLTTVANEIADDEGQPRDSVTVIYFKTSEAETSALDAYINTAKNQQDRGNTPHYWGGFRDCISYCLNGFARIGKGNGSAVFTVPNVAPFFFWQNQGWATGKPDPEKDRKPPHKDCLKTRDGKCVD
ncbi:MAG: RHS repeat-associated core domain-containing protein, partial [Terriglobales bacterium]